MALLVAGCATNPAPKAERGPGGTIAYQVQIEATEPGARIEANNDFISTTPTTLKIFGDKDGTLHNFGSQEFIIRAFPLNTNQTMQVKVFRTGGWFSQEDQIPRRIFFDMNQRGSVSVESPSRY